MDDATAITVTLGDTDRSVTEGTEVTRPALRWTQHETYRPNIIRNDIAIIQIEAVTLSTAIQRVCLAPDNGENYEGKIARISGWGKTSDDGSVVNQLSYIDVPVLTYELCNADFPVSYSNYTICTDTKGGKGTCNGDSGGPLVYNDGSSIVQIGIVSFGSGRGCLTESSVYTRVSSYRSWVIQNGATNIC